MALSILLAITSFVYAANNIGIIRSSFSGVSGRDVWFYIFVLLAGFTLGYIIEGYKVGSAVTSSLVRLNESSSLVALVVVFMILTVFTFLKLPASISNVSVGAIVGVASVFSLPLSLGVLWEIMASWLVAPLTSALLVVIIYTLYSRLIPRWSLTSAARFNRLFGIVVVAFTSYSLSANNLGILTGFSDNIADRVAIIVFAVIGSVIMSGLVAWTLGWRIAVLSPTAYTSSLLAGSLTLWIYTQFGIPASLAQTVVSAMMVLSIYKKPSIVNSRLMFEILGSWPFFLGFSFALAYLISSMLL